MNTNSSPSANSNLDEINVGILILIYDVHT